MKKYIILGFTIFSLSTNLFSAENHTNTFSNQRKIDSFVDKIVEEKNENLIKQADFDKEYLSYLRSKEAAKNKKPDGGTQNINPSGNGFINGISMTR